MDSSEYRFEESHVAELLNIWYDSTKLQYVEHCTRELLDDLHQIKHLVNEDDVRLRGHICKLAVQLGLMSISLFDDLQDTMEVLDDAET